MRMPSAVFDDQADAGRRIGVGDNHGEFEGVGASIFRGQTSARSTWQIDVEAAIVLDVQGLSRVSRSSAAKIAPAS